MQPKRSPSRLLSQLLVFALVATHLPSAAAGDDAPATPPRTPLTCPPDPDRKDVALCEGAVSSTCEKINDFSKERREGGLGKEILLWPELNGNNDTEYGNKVREFQNRNKDWYLDQLSAAHKALNGKPASLQKSIEARAQFFQAMFGTDVLNNGTHFQFPVGVVFTCEAKRKIRRNIGDFMRAQRSLDAGEGGTTANACSGAFEQMFRTYSFVKDYHQKFLTMLNDQLDGRIIEHRRPNGSRGLFMGFRQMFSLQAKANEENIRAAQSALAPELMQKLKDEYEHLWVFKPQSNANLRTNGLYAQFIRQLTQERELAKKTDAWLERNKAQFEDLQRRCGSATPQALPQAAGNGRPDGSTITGDPARPQVQPAAGDPQRPDPPAPNARPTAEPPAPEVPPRAPAPEPRPPADEPPLRGSQEPPPPAASSAPDEPSKVGTFLKDNWMWLVGGAGVVVGGVYLYKQHKKKEDERKYWRNEVNFLTSGGTTTTGASGSSSSINIAAGGNVPAGTKVIIVTPPSQAIVGQAIGKVELALVNAAGVVQNINGLAIEASCLRPSPCSLTGAKSVTSVNGKVTFDMLAFNQPDKGVVLQFSGPGLQSVTTPGTFDVLGLTERQ